MGCRIKKLLVIIAALWVFLSCVPFSFAAIPVNSPLERPIPSLSTEGGTTHIVFYQVFETVYQEEYGYSGPILVKYDCNFPSSYTYEIYNNGMNAGLVILNQNTNVTVNAQSWDVVTGRLIESKSNLVWHGPLYGGRYLYSIGGHAYFPNNSPSYGLPDGYYYIASEGASIGQAAHLVDPFVNWSVSPAALNIYKSHFAEPVTDDLNRYFVLAGEEGSQLYVVSYFMQEYDLMKNVTLNQSLSEWSQFTTIIKNYVAPKIKLHNGQLILSIYCDENFFQLVNPTDVQALNAFDIMVSEYDLLTGQYINSQLYQGVQYSENETILEYNFGNYHDYDSIKTWGVYYIDDNTSDYHYNYLACYWGVDPEIESWRDSVLEYLQMIYNILNQSAEEEVTIDTNMSAVDEFESAKDALQVTGENGQPIDAGEAAGEIFSNAAVELGNLSESTGTINSLMQRLIFSKPKLLLPLIVALSLGLLVTIVGKNKSD